MWGNFQYLLHSSRKHHWLLPLSCPLNGNPTQQKVLWRAIRLSTGGDIETDSREMDNDTAQTSTPLATKPTAGTLTSPTINGISEAEWRMMGIMSVLEDMAPIIAISDPSTTQATYHRIRAALTTAFQRPLDPAYHALRDSITAKTEWLHANGFYSAFLASVQLVGDLWPWITASDAPVLDVHERWMRCRKLEPYVIQLKERYEDAGGMARHVCAVERLGRLFLELAWYVPSSEAYYLAQDGRPRDSVPWVA